MAKWVRYFFRWTSTTGEKHVFSGPAYRGLALVKMETGLWSLTHMKTGACVMKLRGDYHPIRKLGTAIAELADWEAFDTVDEISDFPGLAQRVKSVADFYSAEDEVVGHG